MQILSLPIQHRAALKNILLVQLFQSSDRNKLGNEKIFCHLIDQVKNLEKEGISLSFENKKNYSIFCNGCGSRRQPWLELF